MVPRHQSAHYRVAYLFAFVTTASATLAAEWPQYRGPHQDGISTETANLKWSGTGPKVAWKIPTHTGFSSFTVSDGKVFTQVARGSREVCVALQAATGRELWAADVGLAKYQNGGDAGAPDNKGGDGPRSTPTINDGRVYVLTPALVLFCCDAATGKKLWSHDVMKEYAGRNIMWSSAASPVVDGDLVFLAGGGAGQSLLAFNKKTGQLAWQGHDEIMTHATPVVATILGERQVIFFVKSGLLAVSVKDGQALWRFPFPFRTATAISPVVAGDIVFCSAGYGVGGGACKIAKDGNSFTATELWKSANDKQVGDLWSTPVHHAGYLYGMISFKKFGTGPLKCVELTTGKVVWEQAGFGAGNVILVGDQLIALTDDGQVVIVEATPTAYKEVARFKALSGKCWSTPAFSDGQIYVRSTKEGACLIPSGK
ncbi:MAG: alcohol dehydrogenase [Verrucomicrobia bacterium]|nr:MAG: alcohol dehydrogenase [Verrucomicrobiota bacterium]